MFGCMAVWMNGCMDVIMVAVVIRVWGVGTLGVRVWGVRVWV